MNNQLENKTVLNYLSFTCGICQNPILVEKSTVSWSGDLTDCENCGKREHPLIYVTCPVCGNEDYVNIYDI